MSTHNHEECADCIAREAAARREALLEATECPSDEWGITWQSRARRLTTEVKLVRAKVARVEALAEAMAEVPDFTASDYDRGRVDQRHANAEELWAALAESERDEEGER